MAEKNGPLPKKWPKHPPRRKHCNNYPPWNHRSPCKIGHPPQGSSSNHQLFGVNLLFREGILPNSLSICPRARPSGSLGFSLSSILSFTPASEKMKDGIVSADVGWIMEEYSYRSYLIFANFSNHNFFLKKTLGFCSLNFKKSKKKSALKGSICHKNSGQTSTHGSFVLHSPGPFRRQENVDGWALCFRLANVLQRSGSEVNEKMVHH